MDLRCPFGCRQHHRRQRSNQRSTAYYQTAAGQWKKKRLNSRRQCRPDDAVNQPPDLSSQAAVSDESRSEDELQKAESEPQGVSIQPKLRLGSVLLDESGLPESPMLPYVRMVASLIEGIPIGLKQMIAFLRQAMRQHSIAKRSRGDYVLHVLNQHPP